MFWLKNNVLKTGPPESTLKVRIRNPAIKWPRLQSSNVGSRVVDLDSLNPDTDPDPAFQVNPDPDISDQGFYDQKLKKKIQQNFCFFIFFSKNCNLLIPRPPQRTSKLQ